ncbi:MAG TPA: hypothetical protein VKT81_24950 [Bryobacteraceae bacterium]|nr:hypothetical protein [Bryobacteraceae bacterium]
MLQLPLDQLILFIAQAVLLVLLIARLWSAQLQRIYPFFFGYLLAELLRTAILAAVPYRGPAYPKVWVATELFVDCFYPLIVVELYRVVLRDLPGIATAARRFIAGTVVVATFGSLLLLRLEETPKNYVSVTFVIDRAVIFSMVIFILLVSMFLLYYPVRLSRNAVFYSIGYAVYFLTKAAGLFVRTLGYYIAPLLGTAFFIVFDACLLFWILTLNKQGELSTVVLGHKWKNEDEALLLSKLKDINAHLLAAGKK